MSDPPSGWPSQWEGAESGGSLGLEDPPEERSAFAESEEARYQEGGLIGWGGMGEVRAAFDRRLNRLVALKVPRSDAAGPRARLVDEATLTASLEHPGIVPIYGAGQGEDGRPYYTMPVVRGRSLGAAIAQGERLQHVRAFLDVCDAVAFAHDRGVLHRDLKPSNILVGDFGETLVVDWGLAGAPGPSSGALGTAQYAAPEQQRGGQLDERSDVYGLGAILHELLSGAPPHDDGGQRRRTELHPPELAAVVRRALEPEPDRRYPSAQALAADVLAWFEGRRVAAYRYSNWELTARWARRFAGPLIVAAVLGLALIAAVAVGYWQTALERDRAQGAEADAVAARQTSDRNLARALVAQARTAADGERRAQAEVLASAALELEESPEARGVLARFVDRPRPRLVQRWQVPGCNGVPSLRGRLACLGGDGLRVLRLEEAGFVEELRSPLVAVSAVFSGPDEQLVAATEGMALLVEDAGLRQVELAFRRPALSARSDRPGVLGTQGGNTLAWSGSLEAGPRCPDGRGPLALDAAPDGATLLLCDRQGVVRLDPTGPAFLHALDPDQGPPSALVSAQDGTGRTVVGTSSGHVTVLGPRGEVLAALSAVDGLPMDLALFGPHLAVSQVGGGVLVWDLERPALPMTLPSRPARLRWLAAGTLRVSGGGVVDDWRLPRPGAPGRLAHDSGIAAVDHSPDGRLLAVAHGSGQLRVHDLETGAVVHERRVHWSVLKDVAFSPDGRWLAAVAAQDPAVHVLDVADWSGRSIATDTVHARAAWATQGTLVALAYSNPLVAFSVSEDVLEAVPWGDDSRWRDLDPSPEGFVGLTRDGAVRSGPAAFGAPHSLHLADLTDGRAVASAGGVVAGVRPHSLHVLGPHPEQVDLPGGAANDVAVSADGSLIAVGHLDGATTLWSTAPLRLRATLRAHGIRVSALDFADGRLATGSWDGDVRLWSLDALAADPGSLSQELQAAWGYGVEDALGE